jgi:hypothetical protein
VTARRRRFTRLALAGVFVALVCVGALAIAISSRATSYEGLFAHRDRVTPRGYAITTWESQR